MDFFSVPYESLLAAVYSFMSPWMDPAATMETKRDHQGCDAHMGWGTHVCATPEDSFSSKVHGARENFALWWVFHHISLQYNFRMYFQDLLKIYIIVLVTSAGSMWE